MTIKEITVNEVNVNSCMITIEPIKIHTIMMDTELINSINTIETEMRDLYTEKWDKPVFSSTRVDYLEIKIPDKVDCFRVVKKSDGTLVPILDSFLNIKVGNKLKLIINTNTIWINEQYIGTTWLLYQSVNYPILELR